MERDIKNVVDGWEISLSTNVHMYAHALSIKKGDLRLSIDCEDLPTSEKTIGIWLHNLDISKASIVEVSEVLQKWTKKFDVKFRIYTSMNEFITNA